MEKKRNQVDRIFYENIKFISLFILLLRYCQLVSDKNSIKRRLYSCLAVTTNMNLEDTIFIDECKIELETHLPHRWREVYLRPQI